MGVGLAVSWCQLPSRLSVIEASNGDTDRRIRQELAPGIAGARAQGRIVDELERSLRIDRYDVLDAVRRVEDARQ